MEKTKTKKKANRYPPMSVSPGSSCVHACIGQTSGGQGPCHPGGDCTAGSLRGKLSLMVDSVEKEKEEGLP